MTERDVKDRRWFDPTFKVMSVKILPGEHYVSSVGEEMIVTVLGSCIAACAYDRKLRIGGMNHFMLPESAESENLIDKPLRYGNHAMEELLNNLFRLGSRKENLEIKVFGGGNVLSSMVGGSNNATVGVRNAEFIRRYLKDEQLPLTAEDLGGIHPRRVHFFPRNGKIMRLYLRKEAEKAVLSREMSYRERLRSVPVEGDVELFG